MQSIYLGREYLVSISGTSEGTQDKFFKDGYWYKTDYYGGEGMSEYLTSIILKNSTLHDNDFVEYIPLLINDKSGCVSKNFLSSNENFITLYRLYNQTYGGNIAEKIVNMNFEQRINYVLDFVSEQTGLDLHAYFANIFALDYLILNEDRHFNNLGIIFDGHGFRKAPIFDNGKSFFVGNYSYKPNLSFEENLKRVTARPFTGSHQIQYEFLKDYCTLKINSKNILNELETVDNCFEKEILLSRLKTFHILDIK